MSCAVITMPANGCSAISITASFRMYIETWLSGTAEEARAVLLPYPSDEMIAWPVSTRANTQKNDGPDLIQPWEGEGSLL